MRRLLKRVPLFCSPDSAVDSKTHGARNVILEERKHTPFSFKVVFGAWHPAPLGYRRHTSERTAQPLRGRELLLSLRKVRISLILNCGIRVQRSVSCLTHLSPC